ncbi:MAG TPA: hypothetical protein VJ783_16265 [Pirellulales bacterium]|nr:hypothetical protein [Pirellulales bacterium]
MSSTLQVPRNVTWLAGVCGGKLGYSRREQRALIERCRSRAADAITNGAGPNGDVHHWSMRHVVDEVVAQMVPPLAIRLRLSSTAQGTFVKECSTITSCFDKLDPRLRRPGFVCKAHVALSAIRHYAPEKWRSLGVDEHDVDPLMAKCLIRARDEAPRLAARQYDPLDWCSDVACLAAAEVTIERLAGRRRSDDPDLDGATFVAACLGKASDSIFVKRRPPTTNLEGWCWTIINRQEKELIRQRKRERRSRSKLEERVLNGRLTADTTDGAGRLHNRPETSSVDSLSKALELAFCELKGSDQEILALRFEGAAKMASRNAQQRDWPVESPGSDVNAQYKAIAKELGITASAAKQRGYRALERFKEIATAILSEAQKRAFDRLSSREREMLLARFGDLDAIAKQYDQKITKQIRETYEQIGKQFNLSVDAAREEVGRHRQRYFLFLNREFAKQAAFDRLSRAQKEILLAAFQTSDGVLRYSDFTSATSALGKTAYDAISEKLGCDDQAARDRVANALKRYFRSLDEENSP